MTRIEIARIEAMINSFIDRKNSHFEKYKSEMIELLKDSNEDIDKILNDLWLLGNKDGLEVERFIASLQEKKAENTVNEEEVKQNLNMENVTDFIIDGKGYIKINFKDNNSIIIENQKQLNSKEIFEDIQQRFNINSLDGVKNSEEIFNYLRSKYVEIPLKNTTLIDSNSYSAEDIKMKAVVDSQYPNETILTSLENNIYVLKGESEKIVRVVMRDGTYVIEEIEQQQYKTTKEDVIQANDSAINNQVEQPQEMDYNNDSNIIQTEIATLITEGKSQEQAFEILANSKNITDVTEQRILFELISEIYTQYHDPELQQEKLQGHTLVKTLPSLKDVA